MAVQQYSYNREKISINIARLKRGGETFEVILKDVDKAIDLRTGKDIDIREVMNGEFVFHNAHKAEKVKESAMKQWLGTEDHFEAAKIIIKKGEIQLTSEQRKYMLEEKEKRIINYIHTNACDPKTKLPIPIQRIKLAIKEAKIHVDPTNKIDYQIKKIISKLQSVLPMSFEKIKLRIIIPAKYTGTAYNILKNKYALTNENWRTDGSLQLELEIVAGIKSDLYSLLNKLTNGEVIIKELK